MRERCRGGPLSRRLLGDHQGSVDPWIKMFFGREYENKTIKERGNKDTELRCSLPGPRMGAHVRLEARAMGGPVYYTRTYAGPCRKCFTTPHPTPFTPVLIENVPRFVYLWFTGKVWPLVKVARLELWEYQPRIHGDFFTRGRNFSFILGNWIFLRLKIMGIRNNISAIRCTKLVKSLWRSIGIEFPAGKINWAQVAVSS